MWARMVIRLVEDQGTVRIDDAPASVVARLPGCVWDPRVGSHRAAAFRLEEIAARLRRMDVAFTAARGPERRPHLVGPELRPYQQAALLAWDGAGRRGLVVLPTGAGKTRVALAAIARTGAKTLCLVPTRALLYQWRASLEEALALRVGVWGDGHRDREPVTVATYEGAARAMDLLGSGFELLVVDEAHHLAGTAGEELLEMSSAPARLGLTATPPEAPALDRLVSRIGPIVCEQRITDLTGTWLAPLHRVVLRVQLEEDERKIWERERATFRRFADPFRDLHPAAGWADLVRAAMRSDEGRRAIASWRAAREMLAYPRQKSRSLALLLDRHREVRSLVFVADNRAAYAVARDHLVWPLTCEVQKGERERALSLFKDGTIRALVSARVLNEGIDVPDAHIGIVLGSAQGAREHVQRAGRVLRPAPGKDRALLYELLTDDTTESLVVHRRARALGLSEEPRHP